MIIKVIIVAGGEKKREPKRLRILTLGSVQQVLQKSLSVFPAALIMSQLRAQKLLLSVGSNKGTPNPGDVLTPFPPGAMGQPLRLFLPPRWSRWSFLCLL